MKAQPDILFPLVILLVDWRIVQNSHPLLYSCQIKPLGNDFVGCPAQIPSILVDNSAADLAMTGCVQA